MKPRHHSWNRLPITMEEVHLYALGKPMPGWCPGLVPFPRPDTQVAEKAA